MIQHTPRFRWVEIPEMYQIVDTRDGEIMATVATESVARDIVDHLNRGSMPAESVAPDGRWTQSISEPAVTVNNLRAPITSGDPSCPNSGTGARISNPNKI